MARNIENFAVNSGRLVKDDGTLVNIADAAARHEDAFGKQIADTTTDLTTEQDF